MAQLFVLCFMYSTATSPAASSCSSSFEQLTPPKLQSKRARFADAVHNSTAEVQPARSVWDLIVFGFELEMLKLHMRVLHPVVAGFLVTEASIRFQTAKSKPTLLSDGLSAGTLPPYMREKTAVRVLGSDVAESRCKGRVLIGGSQGGVRKRYSGRCFQQQQRLATLEMFLERAGPDDLAVVSDVDEIARPEVLSSLASCHPYSQGAGPMEEGGGLVLSARQFKFGVHCDTGYVWYEGPKVYAARFLRREQRQRPWTAQSFDDLRRVGAFSLATQPRGAWHLTSFGSTLELHRKLTSFGAANLFAQEGALDIDRLTACTARCFELLDRGAPSACPPLATNRSHGWRKRMGGRLPPRLPGRRITQLAGAELPPPLLAHLEDFPASWFAFLQPPPQAVRQAGAGDVM